MPLRPPDARSAHRSRRSSKEKPVLSGFHEAALASFGAATHIFPDEIIHMHYITICTRLYQVLGVASPVFD